MVPLEKPPVLPRKQQGVLENAAIAMGHWIGSFSLAPAPADVSCQSCPLAPLAAPVLVASEDSPSPGGS